MKVFTHERYPTIPTELQHTVVAFQQALLIGEHPVDDVTHQMGSTVSDHSGTQIVAGGFENLVIECKMYEHYSLF